MTAQHEKQRKVYLNGYEAMQESIADIGWHAARDEFNEAVPNGQSFLTQEGYYFAKGGLQALVDTMRP